MRRIYNIILLILISGWGCSGQDSQPEAASAESHKIHTNETALGAEPDTSIQAIDFTLPDLNGNVFTLSEHKGDVIVLNFWATWCGPCIEELPDFIELQEEMADKNVRFVGISVESEDPEIIKPFAEKHNINYTLLTDDGTFNGIYGPMGVPRTFIINHRGEVAHVIITSTTKNLLKPLLTDLGELAGKKS